jgi:hypothetical protein
MPVTHLLFSFLSYCESLDSCPPLVVSENEPALANTHESHGKPGDLPEPNKRNQTNQVFIKKISQRQRFCLKYLGSGLPGGEPNVRAPAPNTTRNCLFWQLKDS